MASAPGPTSGSPAPAERERRPSAGRPPAFPCLRCGLGWDGLGCELESSVRGCPCPESRCCSGTDPSQRIGRRRQDAEAEAIWLAQSASSERRPAGTDPPRRIGRRSERPATGHGQPRTVPSRSAIDLRRQVVPHRAPQGHPREELHRQLFGDLRRCLQPARRRGLDRIGLSQQEPGQLLVGERQVAAA